MPRVIWVFAGHTSFCWFCHAAAQMCFFLPLSLQKCSVITKKAPFIRDFQYNDDVVVCIYIQWLNYCNDPKFLDRQVWANSVDPDQTIWSRSTLFVFLSASFGCDYSRFFWCLIFYECFEILLSYYLPCLHFCITIWAASWQNQQNDLCTQRRLRSAQSDQRLCCPHEETLADAQADLSLRWAHRSFCWFSYEVAHLPSTLLDPVGQSTMCLICNLTSMQWSRVRTPVWLNDFCWDW